METYSALDRSPTVGREDTSRPFDGYRRRSPGSERRQRSGRGRSRSPINIDRYQPDRGRDEYYNRRDDFRRRTPPTSQGSIDRYIPGQDLAPPALLTNPLPNPLTLDYQVGFNWFAEWWRMEQMVKDERERQKNGGRRVDRLKGEKEARDERGKEREQIQAAYDTYKEKLQMQMAKNFVQQHKGDVWFKEKYDPELRNAFKHRLADFRQSTYNQWLKDLEVGTFDEFTLEGIYKSDSNGAGGVVEKEEGEATAANEVLGVGDLVPLRGGDLRDESAFSPTLLIKTIAPTVSREKMEIFCKEHLGESEGGFRWLSLSDPNPQKKCHRIGWVLLNSINDIDMRRDSRGGDDDEEVVEDGAQSDNNKTAAEKAASELNGKTIQDAGRGDFTCHVGIHEPPSAPRKKALWDLFSAPERVERDLQLVTRLTLKLEEEMNEITSAVVKIDEKVEDLRNSGRLQPVMSSVKNAKAENGVENGEDQNMKEDGEEGEEEEEEEEEGACDDEEEDDEELLAKKKKLDLLVEYLRRVYNFCFFCVFESDSVHELVRKCPGGHLRRPRSSLTTSAKTVARASAVGEPFPMKKQEAPANGEIQSPTDEKKPLKAGSKTQQQLQRAFNWVKTYEEKLFQILDPDSVDLKKIGGRPLDEALEEELKKFVKQEDEAKFRCKVPECTKLFKGPNFWRKHVEKRHNEFFERIKEDIKLVNTYVLDPSHIAPSRSDANSNGHFPVNNHTPAGTPRGFNLATNLPFGVSPGMTGTMASPAAFQAFFGQQAAGSGWMGPAGEDDRHHTGPRRNNNRYAHRHAGPYDRSHKDSRNMRWNVSGRLTSPRGGHRPVVPRFADGSGGPATVGPREAVQGRSLKSYEDLDAVGGGGNGELNY